jgi:hypothetical protein
VLAVLAVLLLRVAVVLAHFMELAVLVALLVLP